jgi:hypothetical protein
MRWLLAFFEPQVEQRADGRTDPVGGATSVLGEQPSKGVVGVAFVAVDGLAEVSGPGRSSDRGEEELDLPDPVALPARGAAHRNGLHTCRVCCRV